MDDRVLVEVGEDGVALVTLNRPEARNPLDPEVQDALVAAVLRLDADPAVRCVRVRHGAVLWSSHMLASDCSTCLRCSRKRKMSW